MRTLPCVACRLSSRFMMSNGVTYSMIKLHTRMGQRASLSPLQSWRLGRTKTFSCHRFVILLYCRIDRQEPAADFINLRRPQFGQAGEVVRAVFGPCQIAGAAMHVAPHRKGLSADRTPFAG